MKKIRVMLITLVLVIMGATSVFAVDAIAEYPDGSVVTYFDEYDTWTVFKNGEVRDGAVYWDVYIVDIENEECLAIMRSYEIKDGLTWGETIGQILEDANIAK